MASVLDRRLFGSSRREAPVVPARRPAHPTASFFAELRQHLKLSVHQAAAVLQTTVETIVALETGRIDDLPPWTQTRAIVSAYAELAGIDAGPAILCLEADLRPTVGRVDPVTSGTMPSKRSGQSSRHRAATAEGETTPVTPTTRRRRRLPGRALTLRTAAVTGLMAIVGYGSQFPSLQAAIVPGLPVEVAVALRDARDAVTKVFSRRIDGMAWIDVDDPRSRRGDKLPRAARGIPKPKP